MTSPRPRSKPPTTSVTALPDEARQNWLMHILDAAIVKVPAVKYALGVAGVFVVVAIVVGLNVDYRVAVFGTLATFVFMVLLLVFAKLTTASPKVFVAPVTVLLWAFMLLAIATSVLLLTSVFFRIPVDLQGWLRSGPAAAPAASNDAAPPLAEVLASAAPPRPAVPVAALALDVGLFARRAGANELVSMADGESLATNEEFCIVVSPATAGYLYVLQQDSAGHVQWLFPAHAGAPFSSGANPVVAGRPLTMPSDPSVTYVLDATAGTETVIVAFSATPWPALESALPAPASTRSPASASDLARVPSFRGIGGMRRIVAAPLAMAAPPARQLDGHSYALPGPSELQSADNFLVIRRSFRHVGSPQSARNAR